MDSVLMKRPYDYADEFVKPKRQRKNTKAKQLEEDINYAEIDTCSEVGVDLPDSSFNKFDGAESIVGFFGGETPVKAKGEDEEDNMEESDEEYDEKELFTEEDDEYEDDDCDSLAGLKNGNGMKEKGKTQDTNSNTQDEESSMIEILQFDEDNIIIKNNAPYFIYQNHIKELLETEVDARATFLQNKVNTKYAFKKMNQLKKKTTKAKQFRDEFLRIAERKLKTKFEKGDYKKIDGIVGNVYTEVYLPAEKEPDALEDLISDAQLEEDLALSDENMELTLESLEADDPVMGSELEFSDMDLDNTVSDDESHPELNHVPTKNKEETEETKDHEESSIPFPTDSILDPTRHVPMNLTDIDIPERPRDDDLESTASDLDFFVSDEVKELQKLHKIPNDILRMLNGGDETKLLELLEAIEKENEECDDTLKQGNVEVEEKENEAFDESEDQRHEEEVGIHDYDSLGEFDDDDEEIVAPQKKEEIDLPASKDTLFDSREDEKEIGIDSEEDEDEREEDKENGRKLGTDRVPSKPNSVTLELGESNVLSEIQHTPMNPIISMDQQPPPGPQAVCPTGDAQRNKIVLGCVGIPRDQLPYVKIVWVPTIDIIKAYRKFDSELCQLAQGPDGSVNNEALIARLMQQREGMV